MVLCSLVHRGLCLFIYLLSYNLTACAAARATPALGSLRWCPTRAKQTSVDGLAFWCTAVRLSATFRSSLVSSSKCNFNTFSNYVEYFLFACSWPIPLLARGLLSDMRPHKQGSNISCCTTVTCVIRIVGCFQYSFSVCKPLTLVQRCITQAVQATRRMREVISWRSQTALRRCGCCPAGTLPSTRALTLRRSSAATCMRRRHIGAHSALMGSLQMHF